MSPEMVHAWRQIHIAPAEPCDFPAKLSLPSRGHIWNVLKSSRDLQGVLGNVCNGALSCLAPHSPQQPRAPAESLSAARLFPALGIA